MSGTWAQHNAVLQGLLADERARRAARAASAQQARAAAQQTPGVAPVTAPGDAVESWQGGGNEGGFGAPSGPPGDMGKMFGDMSPGTIGGLLGALGGGLALGPFGGLIGGLAGRGIAGLLGGGMGGGAAGALDNDPKDTVDVNSLGAPGIMGVDMGFGGWGPDLGFGMDMGNAEKDGPTNDLGAYQRGGYTGAGRDGVVQPHRPAGVVHEGELVIPYHMVRKMARGMLG